MKSTNELFNPAIVIATIGFSCCEKGGRFWVVHKVNGFPKFSSTNLILHLINATI